MAKFLSLLTKLIFMKMTFSKEDKYKLLEIQMLIYFMIFFFQVPLEELHLLLHRCFNLYNEFDSIQQTSI